MNDEDLRTITLNDTLFDIVLSVFEKLRNRVLLNGSAGTFCYHFHQ